MYLTVAEQIFMLEEKIKKRRTHFLLKDVYDCEIFKLYSKDLNFCWTSLSWKSKKWFLEKLKNWMYQNVKEYEYK